MEGTGIEMKRFESVGVIIWFSFVCLGSAAAAKSAPVPAVIPQPVSMRVTKGAFEIGSATRVVAAGPAGVEAAKLIDALAPAMGFRLKLVEGKGELEAMRVLMDRLSEQSDGEFWVNLVGQPVRTRRGKLVKQNDDLELNKTITFATRQLPQPASRKGILILIDADDACPAELGPALLERAMRVRSDIAIGIVLAKREFEAWFLAGFEGIRGERGFPAGKREGNDRR